MSATLLADGVAAAQEVVVSPEAGANVKVTLRRDSVPQPPCRSPGERCCSRTRRRSRAETGRQAGDTGGLVLRKALLAAAASERVRKAVTRRLAARAIVDQYVAGESSEDAVAVARALRSAGLLVTLDYLGEDTTDAQRAAATAAQYVHLLGKLAAEGLTEGGAVEVSVKPTAVGLLLGTEGEPGPNALGRRIATEHLERIVTAARDAGTTVTVDAEDHTDHRRRAAGRRARCGPRSARSAACCRRRCAAPRPTRASSPRPGCGCGCARAPTPSPSPRRSTYQARHRQVLRALPAHPDGRARVPDDRDARPPADRHHQVARPGPPGGQLRVPDALRRAARTSSGGSPRPARRSASTCPTAATGTRTWSGGSPSGLPTWRSSCVR